jgi:hypothetical protein
MDKVQKYASTNANTPSSETYRSEDKSDNKKAISRNYTICLVNSWNTTWKFSSEILMQK